MTATVRDILDSAEELLDAHSFEDYGPIGLQVAGRSDRVDTIATAVSCTLDVFRRASRTGAQLVLCHHGLFWRNTPQVVDATMRERLATLFESGITLAAYHLPLDAHPAVGNNALIADLLGIERAATPFATYGGRQIGLVGALRDGPVPAAELAVRVRALVGGREPLLLGDPRREVARIAVCSGGAADHIAEAARLGCDAFITGEPREDTNALAHELDIAFLAAGHHATETFGIRALGEWLASRFDLRHEFLDSDNPV